MNRDFVLAKQQHRIKCLDKLYGRCDGRAGARPVSMKTLWEDAGLPDVEGKDAVEYLMAERLIQLVDRPDKVVLTHRGVVEMEAVTLGKGTDHFEPHVVQVFNGAVGAVQNGASSAASVTTKAS